jgi:hypothetical protein
MTASLTRWMSMHWMPPRRPDGETNVQDDWLNGLGMPRAPREIGRRSTTSPSKTIRHVFETRSKHLRRFRESGQPTDRTGARSVHDFAEAPDIWRSILK